METNQNRTRGKGARICIFGNFGTGNFGNEITFQTVLYHVRQRLPEAKLACICANPEVLASTQKIESVHIERDFSSPRRSLTGLAALLRQVFVRAPREMFRWWEAFLVLKGTNMLIVPGTGLLTDAYGLRGWGPYNIFKWSFIAKICGSNIFFLSVGAGPLYSALGKWFVKSALFMANSRSYRDDASMDWLKAIGFQTNGDRVFPDLVFSLPETLIPHDENGKRRRRVVGLGLMVYAGKYSTAEPRDAIYRQYLDNLVVFVRWLLGRDYDIRLLIGETNDQLVVEEFQALLKTALGSYDERRIIDERAQSVEQLLPQIAAADIVVATRFHNLVLSFLLNKPVIAVSFHHKCSSLMSQMGLSEYSHDINHMDAGKLIEQFLDIEKKTETLKPLILEKVGQLRKALDEQYNLIFNAN